jgi:K+-sensing histidine kinase KdpD
MVCIGAQDEALVRLGARLASTMNADWQVV